MLENISLIEQANFFINRKQAEQKAYQYLSEIGVEGIANNRSNQCRQQEIFYTQFIRALLSKSENIIIVLPLQMLGGLKKQEKLFSDLIHLCNYHQQQTNFYPSIILVDIKINKHHYHTCPCHTIK
ncbi:MAG: hypothetical protein HQL46_11830 [Gammaproteobacteria bacterium]|nr:hypothetical protein [Gammaproteobacteria bacterium]